jgi:hypothetical protein
MTAEVAAVGVAIGGDDGGPWLVVISRVVVIDRPKGDDDDDDDDGDYRPSSRRPNSADSKRWRLQQQMSLLCLAAAFRWERSRWIGDDGGDDRRLVKASTIESSFKRTEKRIGTIRR